MDRGDLSDVAVLDPDPDETTMHATQKGRKNIRHIKDFEDLTLETKIANINEKERITRLECQEQKFKEALGRHEYQDELILDYDFKNKLPLVSVNRTLVQKMKSHQKEGVKFMWRACYESLEQIKKSEGSGCIIAHCMGLGKTFQVVALVHTVLSHRQVGTKTVLICCPKNTLMNWMNEFHMWITPDLGHIDIYSPTRFDSHSDRLKEITKWGKCGGVCLVNYELMRILLEENVKESKFVECLCDPGPDLVICDEGHVLKNEETKLSKAMSRIRTLRRIVLTGTPMQNNLREYHCMVQFVKPSLLGTRQEFVNMFVNPILNGQYENSLVRDVRLMKERSHILHKMLLGCVQRFDLSTLKTYLPEKHEYVLSLALTESQIQMYRFYLNNFSAKRNLDYKSEGVALFSDYQSLQRVWTHPLALKMHESKLEAARKKKKTKKKMKKELYGEEPGNDSSDDATFYWTRVPPLWWLRFVSSDDLEDARQSTKLQVLLYILNECEQANEKLLVFSGSIYSLNLIQHFLKRIHDSTFENPSLCNLTSTWEEEVDYLLLTGQTSAEDRDRYCRSFNDAEDTRLRLFLISTKAGGMGINLTTANRAVLFDASWNPSHDIQSIFRIYRIGQKRPCFVYRLVASGTMEEKIYERQVAKESISFRVVDEKQIARHYTERELLELYQFVPKRKQEMEEWEVKDPVLQRLLREDWGIILGVHEHESLLEHKKEEELLELEKNHAWTAYSNVDDSENLTPKERTMLSQLRPDSFDPLYLRLVLERKYPKKTKEEISSAMSELLPRIRSLLERPDFIKIMKKQALLQHVRVGKVLKREKSRGAVESVEGAIEEAVEGVEGAREEAVEGVEGAREEAETEGKENERFDVTETPERSRSVLSEANYPGSGNCSESDESVFLYEITRKKRKFKRKRTPLKVWGTVGGRSFGSPERQTN